MSSTSSSSNILLKNNSKKSRCKQSLFAPTFFIRSCKDTITIHIEVINILPLITSYFLLINRPMLINLPYYPHFINSILCFIDLFITVLLNPYSHSDLVLKVSLSCIIVLMATLRRMLDVRYTDSAIRCNLSSYRTRVYSHGILYVHKT